MTSKLEVKEGKARIIGRQQFYIDHKVCPDCDGTVDTTSIYIFEKKDVDFHDPVNTAKCKCGWKGFLHESLPNIK